MSGVLCSVIEDDVGVRIGFTVMKIGNTLRLQHRVLTAACQPLRGCSCSTRSTPNSVDLMYLVTLSRRDQELKAINEFGKMNEVYATYFKDAPPVRATS